MIIRIIQNKFFLVSISFLMLSQAFCFPKKAFVLFYMAHCPHCQRFDPVLKRYSLSHHIPVLAYTLDGQSLPSFPKSIYPSPQEMNRFFPNGNPVVPTLFMMDTDKKRIYPVMRGETDLRHLDERVKYIEGDSYE